MFKSILFPIKVLSVTLIKAWLFVIFFVSAASAEMITFEKEVEEVVANNQSREQVEAFALQKAKRLAIEEAGTYISSLSIVVNSQLIKDEITALASGVVQAKIVGVPVARIENNLMHVKVLSRIQVDSSILANQVAELLKEKKTIQQLEDEQIKVRELEKKISSLKNNEKEKLEDLNKQIKVLEKAQEHRYLAMVERTLKAQKELKKATLDDRGSNISDDRWLSEQKQTSVKKQDISIKVNGKGFYNSQNEKQAGFVSAFVDGVKNIVTRIRNIGEKCHNAGGKFEMSAGSLVSDTLVKSDEEYLSDTVRYSAASGIFDNEGKVLVSGSFINNKSYVIDILSRTVTENGNLSEDYAYLAYRLGDKVYKYEIKDFRLIQPTQVQSNTYQDPSDFLKWNNLSNSIFNIDIQNLKMDDDSLLCTIKLRYILKASCSFN